MFTELFGGGWNGWSKNPLNLFADPVNTGKKYFFKLTSAEDFALLVHCYLGLNWKESIQLIIYPPPSSSSSSLISPTTGRGQIGSLSLWQPVAQAGFASWRQSQLASPLRTSTLHHALSGMEEKDKTENVCSFLLYHHSMHSDMSVKWYVHLKNISATDEIEVSSCFIDCLEFGSINLLFPSVPYRLQLSAD